MIKIKCFTIRFLILDFKVKIICWRSKLIKKYRYRRRFFCLWQHIILKLTFFYLYISPPPKRCCCWITRIWLKHQIWNIKSRLPLNRNFRIIQCFKATCRFNALHAADRSAWFIPFKKRKCCKLWLKLSEIKFHWLNSHI